MLQVICSSLFVVSILAVMHSCMATSLGMGLPVVRCCCYSCSVSLLQAVYRSKWQDALANFEVDSFLASSSKRPSSAAATPSPSVITAALPPAGTLAAAAAGGSGGGGAAAAANGAQYNMQRLSPATIAAGRGWVVGAKPEGLPRPGGTPGPMGVLPSGVLPAAAAGTRRTSSSASMTVANGDGGGVGILSGGRVGGSGQGESVAAAAAKSKALAAGAAAALEKQEQLRKVANYYKEQYEVSCSLHALFYTCVNC